MGEMYILWKHPSERGGGTLHGYEFTDKRHAERWINQALNVMARHPATCRVYERVVAKRPCSCCGEFHSKTGRAIRELRPRTPTDEERAAFEARLEAFRQRRMPS